MAIVWRYHTVPQCFVGHCYVNRVPDVKLVVTLLRDWGSSVRRLTAARSTSFRFLTSFLRTRDVALPPEVAAATCVTVCWCCGRPTIVHFCAVAPFIDSYNRIHDAEPFLLYVPIHPTP